MKKNKVAVLGGGSWGTALASTFAENDNEVILWSHNEDDVFNINTSHLNPRFLGSNKINQKVFATTDLEQAIDEAQVILFVVPTKAIRQVATQVEEILKGSGQTPIVGHATKGIEVSTFMRISQMISEIVSIANQDNMFFISGPSHAESVIQKGITLVSIASANQENAEIVQNLISTPYFRAYTENDLVGSEFAAAIKNVLAIAGGILTGLNLSDNTQAAFVTRGLAEIKRFGAKMGGESQTFDGLAGLGDLIVTATSPNSRNFKAGLGLAQGKNIDQIQDEMGMVVEGVATTKALHQIAMDYDITMPISEAVYQVVYEDQSIESQIQSLLNRPLTKEFN
ncbi:MAG: NAD(P)H-dependent glycerol-3-phosphate dehydrogenase [Lactobacillaceae bacterium]|jgi:glycerol-3-phosphate dehydrogenase (NAD(P)+)|nr:NAD(P)H-dependent glycerol-3-phosphate dehydrogenase [Lactobacillaceae bacterium]